MTRGIMNRRDFTKLLGLTGLAWHAPRAVKASPANSAQFSITMDDFNWRSAAHLN